MRQRSAAAAAFARPRRRHNALSATDRQQLHSCHGPTPLLPETPHSGILIFSLEEREEVERRRPLPRRRNGSIVAAFSPPPSGAGRRTRPERA
jgi:hypothetical protein